MKVGRKRINRNEAMMETAMIFAQRSTCLRKQVGAVIAQDHRIISIGYNGAPSGEEHCNIHNCTEDEPCNRTIHAEMNAILYAARSGISVEGATVYTTLQPCIECAKAILNAGITTVYYNQSYRDPSGIRLLARNGIGNHRI